MRVLVSGGAGFIGSHIVELLLQDGHELAVLDDLSTGKRKNVPALARFFEVDLRDRDAVFRSVRDFRPNVVCHQAAQASVVVSVRDPHHDANVNVIGSLNLADACTTDGVIERFVFASTGGAIYGEVPEGTRATEKTVPTPISPYAIHKLTFEQLLDVYRRERGLPATVLRYANVYGPRQDPHGEAGVVAIFSNLLIDGRPLQVNAREKLGDDGCVRDYVYVRDVAATNVLALRGEIAEPVINVGTGETTSTRELAQNLMRIAGREVPFKNGDHRPGDLERSVLDRTLMARYLPNVVPLATGLQETYQAMLGERSAK